MTVLQQIQMYSRLIHSEFLSGATVCIISEIRAELIERDNNEMFGPLVARNAAPIACKPSTTECAATGCTDLGFMERDSDGLAYCLGCF